MAEIGCDQDVVRRPECRSEVAVTGDNYDGRSVENHVPFGSPRPTAEVEKGPRLPDHRPSGGPGCWGILNYPGGRVTTCGSSCRADCAELGNHVVDRSSPVRVTVTGPAAGSDRQGERGPGAVRVLDVLVSEVDPPAGARQEDPPAVVSPAGAGRARVALVLAEAVLRGLARVSDVDRGR